jgi:hypothetical protein
MLRGRVIQRREVEHEGMGRFMPGQGVVWVRGGGGLGEGRGWVDDVPRRWCWLLDSILFEV